MFFFHENMIIGVFNDSDIFDQSQIVCLFHLNERLYVNDTSQMAITPNHAFY